MIYSPINGDIATPKEVRVMTRRLGVLGAEVVVECENSSQHAAHSHHLLIRCFYPDSASFSAHMQGTNAGEHLKSAEA